MELNIKLSEIDPESDIFHPASLVSKIMKIVGDNYDKKKGEVNKFMGRISKEDFHALFESGKCDTFKQYCESLEVNTEPKTE